MATKKSKSPAKQSQKSASSKARAKTVKKANKSSNLSVLLILLAVVVIGALAFWLLSKPSGSNDKQSATSASTNASLSLVSSTSSVAVGDKVHVQLFSDSKDIKNNAVQALIKFPSKNLQLVKINSDASAYPIKASEKSTSDTVTVSRGVISGVINKQLVTDMEFVAKESGNAEITYDKSQSFLISSETNKNLLNNDGFVTTNIEVIK